MPVFLLALGRLPYWEHDASPTSVHPSHKHRTRASTALDASGPSLDLAPKGTDGGQVRAPFRIKSRAQSWRAAPSKLHANETCNEKVVYSERCQKQHNRYTRTMDKAHGKRGVYFEFPGKASWSLGHSLSMVYLLHDVCMRARRACHIKLCASAVELSPEVHECKLSVFCCAREQTTPTCICSSDTAAGIPGGRPLLIQNVQNVGTSWTRRARRACCPARFRGSQNWTSKGL